MFFKKRLLAFVFAVSTVFTFFSTITPEVLAKPPKVEHTRSSSDAIAGHFKVSEGSRKKEYTVIKSGTKSGTNVYDIKESGKSYFATRVPANEVESTILADFK